MIEFDDAELDNLLDIEEDEPKSEVKIETKVVTANPMATEDLIEFDDDALFDEEETPEGEEVKPAKSGNDDIDELEVFIHKFNEFGFNITPELLSENDGDLGKTIEVEKVRVANELLMGAISALGEDEKEAVVNLLKGAKMEDIVEPSKVKELSLTEDDLEDSEDSQRSVIEQSLKIKGLSERDIKRYMKGIDEDELLDEAKTALKEVNNHAKKAKEEIKQKALKNAETQRQQREEAVAKINKATDEFFADTTKFYSGVKMQQSTRDAIKAKTVDVVNEVYANLDVYAPRLAYLKHLGVLDGDFSKITAKAKTEAVTSFRDVLKSKPKPSGLTKPETDNKPVKPYSSKR